MTIKKLCEKYISCEDCCFHITCPFYNRQYLPLMDLDNENNNLITKTIIETAKLLQEDKNDSLSVVSIIRHNILKYSNEIGEDLAEHIIENICEDLDDYFEEVNND